jgi:hypothetical protein
MAFKNLEQRFNEKVGDLYAGAKLKFDGGRASTGINDDPLMVRRPGDGRLGIKQEGRSIPFNSAPRDVVRLTLFSASFRGIAFYAKQQLLQTGNTFEITRIINPAFVIGNAVPFLHIRRHLRPLSGLLGRAGQTNIGELRKIGQLQKSTYDRLVGVEGSAITEGLGRVLNRIPVIAQVRSAITANRSVGDGDYGWEFGRPELAEGKYHVYNMKKGIGNQSTRSNLLATIGNRILPSAISRRLSNLFSGSDNTLNVIDLAAVKNIYGVEDGSRNEYITYFASGPSWDGLTGPDYGKFNISAYFRDRNLTGDNIRSGLIINQAISGLYSNKIEPSTESLKTIVLENTLDRPYIQKTTYNLKPSEDKPATDYFSEAILPKRKNVSQNFRYPEENVGDGGAQEFRSSNISDDLETLGNKSTRFGDPEKYLENSALLLSQQPSAPAKDYLSEQLEPTVDRGLFRVSQEQISDNFRSDLVSGESLKNKDREKIKGRITTSREEFQKIADEFIRERTDGSINEQPFLKYFTPDNTGVIISRGGGTNARDLSINNGRRLKYLKDPLNYETPDTITALPRYNKLPSSGPDGDDPVTDIAGNKVDPILISFAMGKDDHVQFRAFIRDINQNTSPEYKTYQYIGRIEKFISYVSVQREVNFKLDILSFSKDELKVVWNRLNYLTSFVFPYGINKGILQPNVVRFTIGKMFRDQPGYVTSLSTSFNEISESWDIDEEVPIAATVNISIAIIEKTTMTANKPFYAINEGNIPVAEVGQVTVISGRDERGFFIPAPGPLPET